MRENEEIKVTETTETHITPQEEKQMEEVEDMMEVHVEEVNNFWIDTDNKKLAVGATAATLATGFVGGFFTGKAVERRKRIQIMNEVEITLAALEAKERGETDISVNGNLHSTDAYGYSNLAELKEVIRENFLKDNKISKKEKDQWIEQLLDLTKAGAKARAKQEKADEEIVYKEKKESEDNTDQ